MHVLVTEHCYPKVVFKTMQPPQTKFTECNLQYTAVNKHDPNILRVLFRKIVFQINLNQSVRVLEDIGLRLNVSK